ncbi:MAG: aminoacetone oxidase family FAD-binding enzyme [Ruminococcaceae bacterium]|nr:aminoacetone oxidase family FAD-binding enzyme [Oscillospiraceae bacterium]
MNNCFHTVIIGGGASGMCAAILLKSKLPDERIVVLESLPRVGKKLSITGNGRCNITNRNLSIDSYHGENVEFCRYSLTKFDYKFTCEFFDKIGVPFCEGEDGKMYPYSLQASSVVDALRFEMDRIGVEVINEINAKGVSKNNGRLIVNTDKGNFECNNVIVATGSTAGGRKIGGTGDGYSILSKLGHKLISPTESLVQLKTETEPIKALNGIKVNASVTSFVNGKKQRCETGELLFTKYGISGPPVLQISRNKIKGERIVKINFFPEKSYNEIVEMLLCRKETLAHRTAENFFVGLLPKMVGHTILKLCDIALNKKVSDFDGKICRLVAEKLYSFTLKVIGTNGVENCQVIAGGISTSDFDETTLESKLCRGVYAIGEVLDIDGDCGGFNLQWAWSSAAAASEGIIGKLL